MIDILDRYTAQVPGMQYIVVDAEGTLFEYAGGWADIWRHQAMTIDTTLMAYSMKNIASVVMVNSTEFDSRTCLNRLDGAFLDLRLGVSFPSSDDRRLI